MGFKKGEDCSLIHINSITENKAALKLGNDVNVCIDSDGDYCLVKKNGEEPFRLLQLTDLHIGNGPKSLKEDSHALSAIANIVRAARPDFIVITGDLIYTMIKDTGTNDNLAAAKVVAELMESFKVPWTLTYGNHDAELHYAYSKSVLSEYYSSLDNCIFTRGKRGIKGQGNAVVKIFNNDGSIREIIFLIDSNMYSLLGGYDRIHSSQIRWYENRIRRYKEQYGRFRSLMFFHIPLKAYDTAWKEWEANGFKDGGNVAWNKDIENKGTKEDGNYGLKGEQVCYPRKDGRMFDAILNSGVTDGIFVGHDHINTYSLIYKGVTLTYGQSIDYLAYGKRMFDINYQRGGTLIEIERDGEFHIKPILLKEVKCDIVIK